ncbi:MAG: LmeA family phospholipid-binding protein, partial [Actinomycetes bacterium]
RDRLLGPTVGRKKDDKGPGLVARLVRIVVVVGVLAVLVEFGGRFALSSGAEKAIVSTGRAKSADVTIGAQPWKPALLPTLTGTPLDRVTVELTDAKVESLTVDRATYQLNDVDISYRLSKHPVRINSIGSGAVRLELSAGSLAAVIGAPVEIADGRVLVGTERTPATVKVVDGMLSVSAPGATSVVLPVDDPDLLMCAPQVSVVGDRVVLACSGTRLPGIISRAVDPPDTGGRPGGPTKLAPPNTVTVPTTAPAG